MKRQRMISEIRILIPFILLILTGCSGRYETPVVLEDSTIFYPSKTAGGIEAAITLCTGVDKKTGEKTGVGSVFTIIEKENLLAFIDLKNLKNQPYRELMFHIDWVDSSGKSMYLKRVYVSPADTITSLASAVNISPEKRKPGSYEIRVYYFRELMAVKKFALRDKKAVLNEIATTVSLSGKKDNTAGESDSLYFSDEKGSVIALVEIKNLTGKFDQELGFDLVWTGPDEKSFYKKNVVIKPGDTTILANSSISISPEKRQPGKYAFRVMLFDSAIVSKAFEIQAKPVVVVKKEKLLASKITFCRKIDKETGLPLDEASVFNLNDNENVRAVVEFERIGQYRNKTLNFRLEWVDPDGKSFYKKKTDLSPDDPTTNISSSISASPDKRQPGKYLLRVFLSDKLLNEKSFELRN